MFSGLSKKLLEVFNNIRNRGVLTPEIVDNAIREIRISLLEADVALPVVRKFTLSLKDKLNGQSVIKSTSPVQTISKYVFDEITELLGSNENKTIKNGAVLMCGLQGAGKTTSSAKLANFLSKKQLKKILLVSLDTIRPAAIEQLQKLAGKAEVDFFADIDIDNDTPVSIARKAMAAGKDFDITIFDTAGRMYVDDMLMDELKQLVEILKPVEKLLVIDSMMGQNALNTADVFNQNIILTGLIMTRIDGDNKGGACLSAKSVTDCQIRFICAGEKIDDIEIFHSDRVASRILDNGDVISLVEKAIDKNMIEEMEKININKDFNMDDMAKYFQQIEKIGGIGGFLKFLPGLNSIKDKLNSLNTNEKIISKQIAIIRAMTPKERRNPKILNASRRRRIASGAGLPVSDVNKLIKQYDSMKLMINKLKKSGGNKLSFLNALR